MTVDEVIELLQAVKDGKQVQFKRKGTFDPWRDVGPEWDTDFLNLAWFAYRVKPQPIECWIPVSPNGALGFPSKHGKPGDHYNWHVYKFRQVIDE